MLHEKYGEFTHKPRRGIGGIGVGSIMQDVHLPGTMNTPYGADIGTRFSEGTSKPLAVTGALGRGGNWVNAPA